MKKLVVLMLAITLLGSCTKQKQKKLEGLWTCQSINNEPPADFFGSSSLKSLTIDFSDNLTFIISETYIDSNEVIIVLVDDEGGYTIDGNEINLISNINSETFNLRDVRLKRNELSFKMDYEYNFTK
jgi:hypothetical protein